MKTPNHARRRVKVNFEGVLAEFATREELLKTFCEKTKALIEASLQDKSIRYHSVQARVKTKEKLRQKFTDPDKDYNKLDDITDLAGLRIITYYEDDVDLAAEVVKKEFILDPKNSIDKRATDPDRFGYHAINYVCWHLKKRTSDVEYKKFCGVRCEIQITSILGYAWSELEHDWYDLKNAYPPEVRRKFSRIMALLQIADSEFLNIRETRRQYQKSVKVRVEAKVRNLPINSVSMRSFIENEPLVAEIDNEIALILGTKVTDGLSDNVLAWQVAAAKFAGMRELQDVRNSLKKYKSFIPEYIRKCYKGFIPPLPKGFRVSKGRCIYHLSFMILANKNAQVALSFLAVIGNDSTLDAASQVTIAKTILSKNQR